MAFDAAWHAANRDEQEEVQIGCCTLNLGETCWYGSTHPVNCDGFSILTDVLYNESVEGNYFFLKGPKNG